MHADVENQHASGLEDEQSECKNRHEPANVLREKVCRMTKPVLIVGAGLASLALARTLLKRNVPFRVLEASPELRKYSYGLTLLPWAYKPLASVLKCGTATELTKITATDSAIGGVGTVCTDFKDAYTGASLLTAQQSRDAYRCSRNKLTQLLVQGVSIQYGSKVEQVENTSNGVLVHFEDGKTLEGSLAVGADGVHSTGVTLHKQIGVAFSGQQINRPFTHAHLVQCAKAYHQMWPHQ